MLPGTDSMPESHTACLYWMLPLVTDHLPPSPKQFRQPSQHFHYLHQSIEDSSSTLSYKTPPWFSKKTTQSCSPRSKASVTFLLTVVFSVTLLAFLKKYEFDFLSFVLSLHALSRSF